jgi:hypothetical protein
VLFYLDMNLSVEERNMIRSSRTKGKLEYPQIICQISLISRKITAILIELICRINTEY